MGKKGKIKFRIKFYKNGAFLLGANLNMGYSGYYLCLYLGITIVIGFINDY